MKRISFWLCLLWGYSISIVAAEALPIVVVGKFENKTTCEVSYFQTLNTRITNSLVNSGKFNLVERERVKDILSERNAKLETAENPERFQIAGFIVYGSILDFQVGSGKIDTSFFKGFKVLCIIELNIRITDVMTSQILGSKIVKVTKNIQSEQLGKELLIQQVVNDTIEEACSKICDMLLEVGYPTKVIQVENDKVYLNIPVEQAKVGQQYRIMKTGDELFDFDTGDSLGRVEDVIATVELVEITPRYAIAKCISGNVGELIKDMTARKYTPPITEEKPKEENQRRDLKRRF